MIFFHYIVLFQIKATTINPVIISILLAYFFLNAASYKYTSFIFIIA